MNLIYSTATAAIEYVEYTKPSKDENVLPVVTRRVLIQGGANLPQKTLVTPAGIVTEVSDEDLIFLMQNASFLEHKKAGFMRVEEYRVPVESVVNDMAPADRSAPLTDADYQPGGRQWMGDKTAKIHSVGKAA